MHASNTPEPDGGAPPPPDVAATERQIRNFAACLFNRNDVVEVRRLKPGRKQGYSTWHQASLLHEVAERLLAFNAQGENVYVGANPRKAPGLKGDDAVAVARCMFVDFDDTTDVDEVLMRCESVGLPRPTVVVLSGNGVHCYWAFTVAVEDLAAWTELMKDLIAAVGGDPVCHNPERIMRLVGLLNRKREPATECRILECDATRRYDYASLRAIVPARVRPAPLPPANSPREFSSNESVQKWLTKYVAEARANGRRNDHCFKLACQLRNDRVSLAEALAAGREFARCMPQGDAPFTEDEAEGAIRSAYRSPAREPARSRTAAVSRAPRHANGARQQVQDATPPDDAGNGDDPPDAPPQATDEGDGGDGGYKLRKVARLKSDIGNAARLAVRYGPDIRFCHQWGKWLVWNGRHWEIDNRGRVVGLATTTVLKIFAEATRETNDARREALVEHATRSQRRERVNAMIDLCKPYVAITPEELDRDPMILNAHNGTVDLRTGELHAHRRGDYCTKMCRANYDPDVPPRQFIKFVQRTFRSNEALIPYVQKALGYSVTGLTTEQSLFFLFGTGANGKTTLMDAVMGVMGDYAGKADRDLLTAGDRSAHPTNIADLQGRRLAVCSETNEGGRWDEAKLKDLVGETRLKARYMRQDFFDFTATHKLWLYSNHKPLVRGVDHGFWRRMRLLPFVETIGEEEKDRALPAKLQAEADGILAWMVAGCLLWQREGLAIPEAVEKATAEYRKEMDTIGAFIEQFCFADNPALQASAADLYASYCDYCADVGERPLSQRRLGTQLGERGFTRKHTETGIKWYGIGLKSPPRPKQSPDSGAKVQDDPSDYQQWA